MRASVFQASSAVSLCTESGSSSPEPCRERRTSGSSLHRLALSGVVSLGSFQSYSSPHISQDPSLPLSHPYPSLLSSSHQAIRSASAASTLRAAR